MNEASRTAGAALSAEDRAILALECDTIAGHTCKVIVLGDRAPTARELHQLVSDRIGAIPALSQRLGGTAAAPAWVPDRDFDAGRHVLDEGGDPLGADALRARVAGLFAQRLERSQPLWRLTRLPLAGGGAALVWLVHHALADGTTVMRFARELLFEPSADGPAAAAAGRHETAAEAERRRAHLVGFFGRELVRSHGRSPFDGSVGTTREVAFARAPLGALHDAAKELAGATVNDAVLTAVAGGIRRWVELRHGRLGDVRVKVPVSLHHAGDVAGNRDSFFAMGLPLGEPDPAERLRAVHAETVVRKQDHDAEELDALHRDLTRLSPHLARLWSRAERSPRRFALNVSNVPGPRATVSILGSPVRALHTIAEIGQRHALRVSVVSYADDLWFGLCADPALVPDLATLADGIAADAAALVARA